VVLKLQLPEIAGRSHSLSAYPNGKVAYFGRMISRTYPFEM